MRYDKNNDKSINIEKLVKIANNYEKHIIEDFEQALWEIQQGMWEGGSVAVKVKESTFLLDVLTSIKFTTERTYDKFYVVEKNSTNPDREDKANYIVATSFGTTDSDLRDDWMPLMFFEKQVFLNNYITIY